MNDAGLGWGGIVRLGLVQAAIGAVVVLTTSTLNRVMVVELGLAASVPGALVAFHYALQVLRPRWGHGSERRRTPWIIGGVVVLAIGAVVAALAASVMAYDLWRGIAMAIAGFVLIGVGVGASGTALLTLLATHVTAKRRAAAASVVWMMMIAGFIATTLAASKVLAPFSFARLVQLATGVGVGAVIVTVLALWRIERAPVADAEGAPTRPAFSVALRTVWRDPAARRFTWFIIVSMLAYSVQDLILEPFAGLAFGYTPAQTSALSALQNGGVLAGMVAVAVFGRRLTGGDAAGLQRLTFLGCLLSGAALLLIATTQATHWAPLLRPAVAGMGFGNGVFAVSAIGLMMGLADKGAHPGVRMGVWGAAQAMAFGGGGFLGTVAVDLIRGATGDTLGAYGMVFAGEGVMFALAAMMIERPGRARRRVLIAAE